MRNYQPDSSTLATYLVVHGWTITHRGQNSSIWALPSSPLNDEVAISKGVRVGSFEWSDILRRIADTERRPERAVAQEFEYAGYDGIRFRIANDGFIGDTVPLHSGAALVSSVQSMLRASATTAQRPRSRIGSGYSRIGDEQLRRARLAHTEHGSFIVPILFQHEEAVDPIDIDPIAGTETLTRESPQRRIVRTLAESLATYKKQIIEPAREVRQSALVPVVAAGGSRELFASLEKILLDESVAEFETRFSWGLSLPASGHAPTSVSIPAAARELVKQTVEVLTQARKQPHRIFTGPIVAYEHEPNDPLVRIAVQTPSSNGRMSRVYMTVRVNRLSDILLWIKGNVTITVQGVVERPPGRPLQLQGISEPRGLDDSFLGGGGDV